MELSLMQQLCEIAERESEFKKRIDEICVENHVITPHTDVTVLADYLAAHGVKKAHKKAMTAINSIKAIKEAISR